MVAATADSTRPRKDQPAANKSPIVTIDVGCERMFGSAKIDFISPAARCVGSSVSWAGRGGPVIIGGLHAPDHNDKVERLVLYAPVYGFEEPAPAGRQAGAPPLGAYWLRPPMATRRGAAMAGRRTRRSQERFDAGEAGFEAWSAGALASDPVGFKGKSRSVRHKPGGALVQDKPHLLGTDGQAIPTTRRGINRFRRWWVPSGIR